MKVVINSATLSKHVNECAKFISNQPLLPQLENFLVAVANNTLTLVASDSVSTIVAEMECEHDGEFAVCLPARLLKDTLGVLPQQPVTIQYEPKELKARLLSDNGKYTMAAELAEDFPNVYTKPEGLAFHSGPWTESIPIANKFASNDQLKMMMNGVVLKEVNGTLFLYAVDGHRIYTESFDMPFEGTKLIPNYLVKHVSNWKGAEISFGEKEIYVRSNGYFISSRMIDDSPIEVAQVIPTKEERSLFTVSTDELKATVKRVGLFANKETNTIVFDLTKEAGKLSVSSEDDNFNQSAEEKLRVTEPFDSFRVGLNSRFLSDFLSVVTEPDVTFHFYDDGMICKFSMENETTELFILPIILHEHA